MLINKDLFFHLMNNHWEPVYGPILFPKDKTMSDIFLFIDLTI